MKKITLEYCGWESSGKTVAEAKQTAAREIKAALQGSYDPILMSWRDHTILCWRTPHGWNSRIIRDELGIRCNGVLYGSGYNGQTEHECARQARLQLAQLTWKAEDGTEPPQIVQHTGLEKEFASWAEFQYRYQDARKLGMSDDDAHSYAGRNPARPELWAEPALA